MEDKTKIFEMGMKIVKVVHTTTEKNDEEVMETKITLESGTYSVTLKLPADVKKFIDGEEVIVAITQPQITLGE